MARFAALLRGVMPTNCKMADLRAAFEAAGFTDVVTVLGSGNVVFTARAAANAALERRAEAAMLEHMGRVFPAVVRSLPELQQLLATNPFGKLRPGAKRVVTFLRGPVQHPQLPVERHGARIHALVAREAFTSYVRTPKGPVFMTLLQETFGKDQTTRTWETIEKVVKAG